MATARQIAANRRNARKSTGPRSSEGKLRSSRNARRHELNVTPRMDEEVVEMLRAILGDPSAGPKGRSFEGALPAAVELSIAEVRVRRAALQIALADAQAIAAIAADVPSDDRPLAVGEATADPQALKDMVVLRRYRREAEARRRKALKALLTAGSIGAGEEASTTAGGRGARPRD